jgi:hypothetical protein
MLAAACQGKEADKAVVSATAPAVIKLASPAEKPAVEPAALQLTVKPEVVAAGEPYLVNVYTVGKAPAGGGKAAESYLGSFSFFPPPKPGEERTFTLAAPKLEGAPGQDITLKIEIVPAVESAKLQSSTLEVVSAKLTN